MRKLDEHEFLFDNSKLNKIFNGIISLGDLSSKPLWFRRIAIVLFPITIMFKLLHTAIIIILIISFLLIISIATFFYNLIYDIRESVKDLWVDKQT